MAQQVVHASETTFLWQVQGISAVQTVSLRDMMMMALRNFKGLSYSSTKKSSIIVKDEVFL
jgi:hypothetical protein